MNFEGFCPGREFTFSMPWKQLRDEVVTRYLKKGAAGKGCRREDVNDIMLSKVGESEYFEAHHDC